jgi:extracellular elastinolytic metalloproteinase
MTRELDVRTFSEERSTPGREQELASVAESVSAALPGDHAVRVSRFDRSTGGVRSVVSEKAPAGNGDFVARALAHVRSISPVLGLERGAQREFAADPHVQRTSSGAAVVNLQQQRDGIPIFEATETVRFNADSSVRATIGSSITTPPAGPGVPALSVVDAVRIAAEHVAEPDDATAEPDAFGVVTEPHRVRLGTFAPRVIAEEDTPERLTRLSGSPFEGELRASLVWFPLEHEMRLGWQTLLTFPAHTARYRVIVDAADGVILYARQLGRTVAARGNVFAVDGATPRAMTDFPLAPDSYFAQALDAPLGDFPRPWVDAAETSGDCVRAHLGADGAPVAGTVVDGTLTFDFDEDSDEQKVLNIFYFNCYMHDLWYGLGFREADGNFQASNRTIGGTGGDPVDARAWPEAVEGTANMLTLEDGTPPVMNMGLVTSTQRHTALDSSVVFHEFMHGVTNRLVGGPKDDASLESPQSGGMGEGWSDWIACTINDTDVVGAWVVDDAAGIRKAPYDENYPSVATFADIGPGAIDEVHDMGEIWAATLLSLNRRITPVLCARLVVDALRLSAANPSFLNMRDDLIEAARLLDAAGKLGAAFGEVEGAIWEVFSRYGMGPGATCIGAQLQGIAADFSVPAPVA